MATTLTDANTAAATARARGQTTLDPEVLATIRNHYRGATALDISTKSEKIITGPCGYRADTLKVRGEKLHSNVTVSETWIDLAGWPTFDSDWLAVTHFDMVACARG